MTTHSIPQEKPTAVRRAGWLTRLRQREAKPYVHPYFGGILLGVLLFGSFFITGNGLGASGGLNRLLVIVEDALVPDHIDRVSYLAEMAGGERNALDSWVVFVTIGVVIGGFASGLVNGRVRLETNRPAHVPAKLRWLMAFIGGGFMGYGARLARGCTSGQALSGGAVLSVGSWAFMFAVFGGAYALAYFVRRLWNE
ncbi:MAG: YeeE/YedE thiosulfate transporter family protein [Chloroflexi bacterium]|nr:YeeE/YedE thiosulfate transporter family protein [Chloroflexota bacterium]